MVTPIKKARDIIQVTIVIIILTNWEYNETQNMQQYPWYVQGHKVLLKGAIIDAYVMLF